MLDQALDHAEWERLADIDGIGALDPEDRERLDAHLAEGCASCGPTRDAMRGAALWLLCVPAPVAPSAELRERVLALLAGRDDAPARRPGAAPAPRRARAALVPRLARIAAALLVAGLLGLLARGLLLEREARSGLETRLAAAEARVEALAREKRQAVGDVERERDAKARDLAETLHERDALASLVEVLGAENLRMLALAGKGDASGAEARAYVAPNGRVVLLGHAFPPAPPGRNYQLWLIQDGQPISAGVFEVDADGRARLASAARAPDAGDLAVAVTLEPVGGVPAPSGPVVLAPR
jgi:hypothetical protein